MGDVDMATREALAERVDPGDLSRHERSTDMGWQGDEDHFQIISYVPSVARKLLQHGHAEIEWLYVRPDEGRRWLEDNIGAGELFDPGTKIEGVCASLPLGALTIKGVPRSQNTHSGIVNTPADAEDAREAFEGGGDE